MATSANGIPSTAPEIALLSSAPNRAGVPPAMIESEKSRGCTDPLLLRYASKIDVAPPVRLAPPRLWPFRSSIFFIFLAPIRRYGAELLDPAATFKLPLVRRSQMMLLSGLLLVKLSPAGRSA